jgi:drug/metabolite transporter (DMT)-like permease
MLLIVDFNDLQVQIGIILGLVSAFLASLFGAFNKKLVFEADTLSITFLELSSAWLFLLVCIPFIMLFDLKALQMVPVASDWVYLLILALLCTTLAYVLALRSLKVVSAFAANLVVNLEPVYGILLAILILNEHKELPGKFYLGFFIIVGIVLTFPYIRKRYEPEEEY